MKLPLKKARNFKNGQCLITSASWDFKMYISQIINHDPLKTTLLPGRQVCEIEIQCGTKLETTYIEIRADMFSCQNTTL